MDIIMNERFYCANYKSLNDPFEGVFSTIEWKSTGFFRIGGGSGMKIAPGQNKTVFKTADNIIASEKKNQICSLSSSMADVRMWSLYASGHTGCAIEVDLEPIENEVVKVNYDKGLKPLEKPLNAIDVLSFKTDHWLYEKEYRIFNEQASYPVTGKITGIYLGIRVHDIHKEIVVRCTPKVIPVYGTKLQGKTVEIEPKERIN